MKKFMAVVLALVLVFSMAACKRPTAIKSTSNVDVSQPYDGTLPLVQPGEDNTITIGIRTLPNCTDYVDNDYTKWLEEKTGVNIEFVFFNGSSKDAGTQVNLMMAGNEELPDILYAFGGINKANGEKYGREGYFVDLKPYFDASYNVYQKESFQTLFGDEWEEPFNFMMSRAVEPTTGGIYSFPTLQEVPLDTPLYHTWINQEWLDKLGLQAPTNVDELYTVLKAFKEQDPNGNGKRDEIPMIGDADGTYADIVQYLINAFVFCNNSYFYNVTDGEVWAPYDTDEYREAMKYINKLVKEGLLDSMSWTQSSEENDALINGVTGAYTVGVICGHADTSFETGNKSIYMYNPLKPLKAATSLGGYAPMKTWSTSYVTYITKDCDNPNLAFKLLDFTMCQESALRQRWGAFDKDWTWADPGSKGHLGGEAKIKLLNPNVWNEQTNTCWHAVASVSSEWYYEQQIDEANANSWADVKNQKLLQNYKNFVEVGMPDEVFTVVPYTQEEADIRSEIHTSINNLLKSSRAEFCTGVRDPYSDADWNAYLNELYSLRYDEWIAINQSAYDRING